MVPALGESEENESTDNPKIGDSGMTLWISQAAISALGLVGTVILNNKEKNRKIREYFNKRELAENSWLSLAV
ncbi:hypothetical protein [Massiliimalia timonensis]|uniref:hypothetical protein n=1 Tax=Massiliimalia timonensis TaxID=1987501 RepID=UPI00189F01B0|nr:hypothetical protein [Massiliimalia timonensis]